MSKNKYDDVKKMLRVEKLVHKVGILEKDNPDLYGEHDDNFGDHECVDGDSFWGN
jgi:hypothetical protein